MSFMIDDEIFTEVDRLSYQLSLIDELDEEIVVEAIPAGDCGLWTYLRSVRFRVCILLCGAMFVMQYMNISMGITIISMTDPPPIHGDPQNHSFDNSSYFHTLDWSASTQGLILSSLSWGRLFTPFSGFLCDRLNSKILIGIGVSVAGIATVLIPTGSQISAIAVMICRVAIGFGDAIVLPTVNRYIAIWFPKSERNLAFSLATGGRQLAVIVVFPLAGFIASKKNILGGWPIVFYVASVVTTFWVPFWLAWANQTPAKHKCISEHEKLKIAEGTEVAKKHQDQRVPWKEMLTSPALLSNIFAIVCHEIPVNVIFIFLPSYMRDVLHFNIEENGLFSGIPAAAFLVSKIVAAHLSDFIVRKRPSTNHTVLMKIFNSIASLALAGFLIGASFFQCDQQAAAITLITLAIGASGLHTPGCISNLVNIAPAFVGTISGLTFFIIGFTSILNPIVVKTVVAHNTYHEWQRVFWALAALAACPIVFFNVWGSSDVQPWGFAHAEPRKDAERADLLKKFPNFKSENRLKVDELDFPRKPLRTDKSMPAFMVAHFEDLRDRGSSDGSDESYGDENDFLNPKLQLPKIVISTDSYDSIGTATDLG